MTTLKEHEASGNFTLKKLIHFRDEELKLSKKWFGGKKHKKEAKFYNDLINKLPNNPTSIDCALTIPDWVLAKMGW